MVSKYKYYPVRTGNSVTALRKWIGWAKKTSPKQKFVIQNLYAERMKDKKWKAYWKMRYKTGNEEKYLVYGSY